MFATARFRGLLATLALVCAYIPSIQAKAGIPECGGVHVDSDSSCRLRLSLGCEAECSLDTVIGKCSTELASMCSGECNLDADFECTNDCGSTCETRCTNGDVVCHDGCFDECTNNCPEVCSDSEDPRKCRASCESTCTKDCDEKCGELSVDASCSEHCNQCCFGSCTAQINIDCQLECQFAGFSDCQRAWKDACMAACGVDGSLFCGGQLVATGNEVHDCMAALRALGHTVDLDVDVDPDDLDDLEDVGEDIQDDIDDAIDDILGNSDEGSDPDGQTDGQTDDSPDGGSLCSQGGSDTGLTALSLVILLSIHRRKGLWAMTR